MCIRDSVYCYVGVTTRSFVVAVLGTLDISKINGRVCIPFQDIEKVSVKRGLIPSQRIIKIKSKGIKMKISLVNNTITAKVKNQKGGMAGICEALEKLQ